MTASLPRTDDRAYDLRQRLNRAVRWLREAEDIARIEMPAWPTADRIRDIYEQVSEDVLNGKRNIPPLLQRLREAEADRDRYGEALEEIRDTDPVDNALDPQRAARIAASALTRKDTRT